MFEWLKKFAGPKQNSVDRLVNAVKANADSVTKVSASKTEKELATEAGEPYVAMLRMDIDPNNLHQGAFELDWNDIFVARLVKAGYMMKQTDADADIVDRWFQNVCRHVVMETWEQEQAIGKQYVNTRDLGNGRTEVS
jgi:hypothetical protein